MGHIDLVKVLLIGSGAGISTKDVEMGYYEAFEELGVDLSFYSLDQRINTAARWLKYQWKYLFEKDPHRVPTWADAVYRGGIEALEMALRYDVDFVFAISAMYLHPDVLVLMRRAGLHVGILFTESPYEDEQQAKIAGLVDLVFTNERTSVGFLRNYNCNSFYLRHAYSPFRHKPVPTTVPDPIGGAVQGEVEGHDVVFVGTGFQERIDLLSKVNWDGINLGLYGSWDLLPSRSKLREHVKGKFLTNMETHALYKASTVGLNLYRTSKNYKRKTDHVTLAESMNPRAYELAAAGKFSLTQVRVEGTETLQDSQPTFTTPYSLESQIWHYLDREEKRAALAQEAIERVQGHTFIERAKEVLSYAIG